MIKYSKVKGDFDLTGKTAVVAGGTGGIGEGIARMYAAKGANVAVLGRKSTAFDIAASISEEYGVKAIGCICDVTSDSDVKEAVAKTVETFGEINVLAAAPGITELAEAKDIGIDVVEKIMNTNAIGVFRICQAAANQMIKQGKGGKIVCVTSQADFIALNKHVAYTMSKAALVGMIKVVAYEWAQYGINVNGVAPTVVNTPMGEKAWFGKVKDDMIARIPAGRFAETEEVAAAVLFLSCDESNMITGEDLVMDGGFTIY